MKGFKSLIGALGMLMLLGFSLLVFGYGDRLQERLINQHKKPIAPEINTVSGDIRYISDGSSEDDAWLSSVDLNDNGQVVGSYKGHTVIWSPTTGIHSLPGQHAKAISNSGIVLCEGYTYAFLYMPDGKIIRLTTQHDIYPHLNDLNDKGQVVGKLSDQNDYLEKTTLACLWAPNGRITTLESDAEFNSINNAGIVVGAYQGHAALLIPGKGWQTIDKTSSRYSSAISINALGHVVGTIADTMSEQCFYWSPEEGLKIISIPDSRLAFPRTINDKDQVLIQCNHKHGPWAQTYLWSPTEGVRLLSPQDGREWEGWALNNAGQVVGIVNDSQTSSPHCFLWTPIKH